MVAVRGRASLVHTHGWKRGLVQRHGTVDEFVLLSGLDHSAPVGGAGGGKEGRSRSNQLDGEAA